MSKNSYTDCKNDAIAFANWLAFEQKEYACIEQKKCWIHGLDFSKSLVTEQLYEAWEKSRGRIQKTLF